MSLKKLSRLVTGPVTLPQERFHISTTTVSNLFDTVLDTELIYLAMTSSSVFKIILINAFFKTAIRI